MEEMRGKAKKKKRRKGGEKGRKGKERKELSGFVSSGKISYSDANAKMRAIIGLHKKLQLLGHNVLQTLFQGFFVPGPHCFPDPVTSRPLT